MEYDRDSQCLRRIIFVLNRGAGKRTIAGTGVESIGFGQLTQTLRAVFFVYSTPFAVGMEIIGLKIFLEITKGFASDMNTTIAIDLYFIVFLPVVVFC